MSLDIEQQALFIYLVIISPPIWYATVEMTKYYAEPNMPNHTYGTLYVCMFCMLALMLLLPIDVASSVADRYNPNLVDPLQRYDRDLLSLSIIYGILYGIILLWTCVVLCFQEYYNTDGYFTTKGKLSSALKRMFWDYVPIVAAGVPALGVILALHIVDGSVAGLILFSKIATNTVYEIFLMFLLGYGLVEFPRQIWSQGNLESLLLSVQTKAATEFTANLEARDNVAKVVANVLTTKAKMGKADIALNEAMKIISVESPSEFRSSKYGEVAEDAEGNITIDTLANLRTKMNRTKSAYRMAQSRLETTQMGAYDLEDLCQAYRNKDKQTKIRWSLKNVESTPEEFTWLVITRPLYCKITAIFFAVLSVFSFLGIIGSFGGGARTASLYFLTVHHPSTSEYNTITGIVIFVFITLTYPILVTTWALFQLRGLGFELVPHRTTPEALSACYRILGGLTFPLCFFYLGWMAENGIEDGQWLMYMKPQNQSVPVIGINGTVLHNRWEEVYLPMPPAFTNFYPLGEIPQIKETFGTIYPLLLFFFLFMVLSQAYNRLCVMMKVSSWQFGDPIVSEDQLAEGMKQLGRFRKIAERTVQRQELTNRRLAERESDKKPWVLFGYTIWETEKKMRPRRSSIVTGSPNSPRGTGINKFKTILPPPPALNGLAFYKCAQRGQMKLKWVEIFVQVVTPGILYFYKDESASEQKESSSYLPDPIDLTLVLDFIGMLKQDKDGVRLKIELVNESIKLRFDSEEEVEVWRKKLLEWRDYNITLDSITGNHGRNLVYKNKHAAGSAEKDLESNMEEIELTTFTGSSTDASTNEDAAMTDNPMNRGGKKKISLAQRLAAASEKKKNFGKDNEVKKEGGDVTSKKNENDFQQGAEEDPVILKPRKLEGFLGKKRNGVSGKVPLVHKYQQRYFVVREDGSLTYHESIFQAENSFPLGSLKLIECPEFEVVKDDDKNEHTRFNIIVESAEKKKDKVMKLKALSYEDAKRWITGLNAWREYFLEEYTNSQIKLYSPEKVQHAVPKNAHLMSDYDVDLTDLKDVETNPLHEARADKDEGVKNDENDSSSDDDDDDGDEQINDSTISPLPRMFLAGSSESYKVPNTPNTSDIDRLTNSSSVDEGVSPKLGVVSMVRGSADEGASRGINAADAGERSSDDGDSDDGSAMESPDSEEDAKYDFDSSKGPTMSVSVSTAEESGKPGDQTQTTRSGDQGGLSLRSTTKARKFKTLGKKK